jgi:hypothetical protein
MKVALASRYRNLMLVLFPATLGLGTAVLWLRSLSWPLSLDEAGIMLRHRRRVEWHSIRKIGLSRSYLDGRVSQIRIHHAGGICKIPVHGLKDGQLVARTILAMFGQVKRARASQDSARTEPMLGRENVGERQVMQARRQPMAVGYYPQVVVPREDADLWVHELTALRETLARRSEKIQTPCNTARSEYDGRG